MLQLLSLQLKDTQYFMSLPLIHICKYLSQVHIHILYVYTCHVLFLLYGKNLAQAEYLQSCDDIKTHSDILTHDTTCMTM